MDNQQKQRTIENEKKWKHFLSSIKRVQNVQSNNVCISTKNNTKCLANIFATKLLENKGGIIEISGCKDTMETYKHLNVKELPTKPRNVVFYDGSQMGMSRADTWPKERSKNTEPINVFGIESARRQLSFEPTKTRVSDFSDEERSPSILETMPSAFHRKSKPRYDIPSDIDSSPRKKVKIEKELSADKTMEHITETVTRSLIGVQEEYENGKEAEDTASDTTDILTYNISINVGNFETNRKVDQSSIKSDIDKSCIETLRETDTPDFTDAHKNAVIDSLSQPAISTTAMVQKEYDIIEENSYDKTPNILYISEDNISNIEENVEIDRRRDRSAHPLSIKSNMVIPNSDTCHKIKMPTDYTAVQEDMAINSSAE
ncbi:unnamed protein product [Mytilus coruscus]|uniref:Uncharacterized protein n=1 Tax=Mytilus coruscus TaxID=42192 RepID=A0A6J8CU46_MYTCO|nr:unnamed protein product [Mytilus coruscus]